MLAAQQVHFNSNVGPALYLNEAQLRAARPRRRGFWAEPGAAARRQAPEFTRLFRTSHGHNCEEDTFLSSLLRLSRCCYLLFLVRCCLDIHIAHALVSGCTCTCPPLKAKLASARNPQILKGHLKQKTVVIPAGREVNVQFLE